MQYSNVPKFINPFYLTVCSFHLKWANVERVARASEAWCLDYVARRAELWRQGWVDPGWVFREIRAVNINKQHTDTWCGDTTLRRVTPSHTQGLQGNFCDSIHWSELKNLGTTGCGWYKCNVWLKKIWSDKHEEYFDANKMRSEYLHFKTFRLCRYYDYVSFSVASVPCPCEGQPRRCSRRERKVKSEEERCFERSLQCIRLGT